jgi:hypothetical protein
MTYVLENINAKGQYLANDMEEAFMSELDSGDVTDSDKAMQFDDIHDLMSWSAGAGTHKAIMRLQFGKDAVVSLDIDKILESYRPKLLPPF